jgi:hypothetical protein
MPSTSPKQAAFMRAVAHNIGFARKVNVPQSVGRDFAAADKRKALANGLKRREPAKYPPPGGVRG